MRILLFLGSELDVVGGTETVLLGLAESFAEPGHTVGILELATAPSKRQLPDKVSLWTSPPPGYPVLRSPHSWIRFARVARHVHKVIKHFKPDIVWVHFPTWQAVPLWVLCALPHEWRLVITAHGSDIRSMPLIQSRLNPWVSRLFKRADAVTAVSSLLLRDVLRQHPYVQNKAQVIPNSIGPSWFNLIADRPLTSQNYVLFVGRLHRTKGVDILLRAWKLIENRISELELWLAGDGPELKNLRKLSNSLNLGKEVRFLGMQPEADLPNLYRNARLVLLPSRNEGLPLAALEAGACGAVSVVTNVGGLPEIIEDGINGFLVEPESPESLAAGILRALELPGEEKQRIGEAASKIVEQRFSRLAIVERYEELFRSLIESEGKPS